MENTKDEEIVVIWVDSLATKPINDKVDIEKGFNYINPLFLVIFFIVCVVFVVQISNWLLLEWDKIDLNDFTIKYSNYRAWWNVFWIFTSMFLHWSFDHIIWNMIFFYIFSLIIYRLFKFWKWLILYIILGIIAWIPSYFLNDKPSIWASGAIFWLFWVATIFYFLYKDKFTKKSTWYILGFSFFSMISNIMMTYRMIYR
jgi:membrane associated rhomboid family serine protease